jgi:hypothetical protein
VEIESYEGEVLNRTVYDDELGLGIGVGTIKKQEKQESLERLDTQENL